MNYQEAFDAFNSGDFHAAAALLERAAEESGYASDLVNHAYTLALYRTGQNSRLADVSFRVGNLLALEDPGIAMDYFQRAMVAGLDASRARQIATFHESMAVSVDARPARKSGSARRVAHVVGGITPGSSSTRYVRALVTGLKAAGIESVVFTTEWDAAWFFNPSGEPRSVDAALDVDTHIAAVEGEFTERAERIAGAIRSANVDVAVFHAGLVEQITTRVAALRPAPIQVHVNHAGEMDLDVFDGRIHLSRRALEGSRFDGPAVWIPAASEIEDRLAAAEPVARQSLGIESALSVSATFGDLRHASGSGYLRVLVEILERFPKHFHLFAGPGDVRTIRPALHAAGVLPRVRFLGLISDTAPLLDAVDVYLAPFPFVSADSILEAMGAGKPVIAMANGRDLHDNAMTDVVEIAELLAGNEPGYIEKADNAIRGAGVRSRLSAAVLERFRVEFRPAQLGRRFAKFLSEL